MKKFIIFGMLAVAFCFMLGSCGDENGQITDVTTVDSAESTLPTEIYIPNSTDGSTSDNIKPETTVKTEATTSSNESNVNATTASDNGQHKDPDPISYAEFISMPPADQQAYMNSFGTDMAGIEKFMAWYSDAKAKYDAEQADKESGDGNINIGDYIGRQ